MVVGRYRRTVSFPNPIPSVVRPSKPASGGGGPPKSYHVRSTSLPCNRSHPLFSHLLHELTSLRSWEQTRSSPSSTETTSTWLQDGLDRLRTVHDSLDDILQLPQTQDTLSLSESAHLVEKLLEDYLRFVDLYGIFRASMISLKQELSSAQVKLRRSATRKDINDSSSSSSTRLGVVYLKSQKKAAKDLSKLASSVRCIDRLATSASASAVAVSSCNEEEEELRGVIKDVHDVTVSVSAALFDGLLMVLGSSRRSASWAPGAAGFVGFTMKRAVAPVPLPVPGGGDHQEMLKKMVGLEDCVSWVEGGSERVFRSLVSTRVSLLNILTH